MQSAFLFATRPNSGPPVESRTLAPSGATFYYAIPFRNGKDRCSLARWGSPTITYAHHIHRIKFGSDGTGIVEEEIVYRNQFGRVRDVEQGPDGFVYFSTSSGSGADKNREDQAAVRSELHDGDSFIFTPKISVLL